MRTKIRNARRLVVKVGSALVTNNGAGLDKDALDAWARQQPETLADMAARYVPLSDALDGLNGALYSETGQQWQGEDLWRAIRTLPTAQDQSTSPQEPSPLPPLYPR